MHDKQYSSLACKVTIFFFFFLYYVSIIFEKILRFLGIRCRHAGQDIIKKGRAAMALPFFMMD